MSLTFEFPQWKLRVTKSKTQDRTSGHSNSNSRNVAGDVGETDWVADLAELDGDYESAGAVDGQVAGADSVDQRVSSCPHQHLAVEVEVVADDTANTSAPSTTGASPHVQHLSHSKPGNYDPGLGSCEGGNAEGIQSSVAYAALQSPGALMSIPGSTSYGPAHLGLQPAAVPRAAPATIRGDSIPAEVLLLVLNRLRDVGDCVRAALVCKHWLSVVVLSNELWYELDSIHLAGDTWHRNPHAGCPLLRAPPGCDHPRSKMLSYKTTCALTQVAVRFMALRKGFDYVVEAAASLWLAACRAAAEAGVTQLGTDGGAAACHGTAATVDDSDLAAGGSSTVTGGTATAAATATSATLTDAMEAIGGNNRAPGSHHQRLGSTVDVKKAVGAGGATNSGVAVPASDSGGDTSASGVVDGSPVGCSATVGGRRRGRITHVDELWESCGRSRTALQVDERFNAVRVQQMVGKLCSSCGAQWLPLYEGVAAVMTSRCDQIRYQMVAEAEAIAAIAAVAAEADAGPSTFASPLGRKKRWGGGTPGDYDGGAGEGAERRGGRQGRGRGAGQHIFRGEVVYSGSSYADQFAELLRRGDTRGALALGSAHRRDAARWGGNGFDGGVGNGGESGGDGSVHWELDEPEMREVIMMEDPTNHLGNFASARAAGYSCTEVSELPAIVVEGLLLWRRLLSSWAIYRRWLEVWVVWCAPLGARVEAERQLAGAATAHGDALLAPPHLTNKGLLLFRSQLLLAYPLRRPLQAAALWLSARAAHGEGFDASGSAGAGGSGGGLSGHDAADADEAAGLSEEHGQLLIRIKKLLTELAVPDDATQPTHLYTRQKLQRCFGGLLRKAVPAGGGRALQLAQRLHGLRAAAAAAAAASRAGGGGGR